MFLKREPESSYSSSIIASLLVAPRDLRARVAVSTIVNCIKLHAQIDNVRYTKIGSSAIFLSLKESKNSMMSAAVPETDLRDMEIRLAVVQRRNVSRNSRNYLPMYTNNSCESWSRVKSPLGSSQRPMIKTSMRNCSINVTHVSAST